MSIIINLLDVPPTGLQIYQVVKSSDLLFSQDEGILLGSLSFQGDLFLTGERSAHFQGNIFGRIARECVRCLDQFEEDLSLSCEFEFKKPVKAASVVVPHRDKGKGIKGREKSVDENATEEDVYPITGNEIDFLPPIREQVILATPLQSLCNENCLGLCQVCGSNLNDRICGCCTPVTDSAPEQTFQKPFPEKNSSKRSSVSVRRGS
jgi:uncharacterized protein